MILINDNLQSLLDVYANNGFNPTDEQHLAELSNNSIVPIQLNDGTLPNIPPFEKHPYLTQLQPNPNITGLMIGTFPPISYLCDTLALEYLEFGEQTFTRPDIPYFHGNRGSLWNYSPLNYTDIIAQPRNLIPSLVDAALSNSGVVYTDIIRFCQRELSDEDGNWKYTSNDTCLNNIVINESVFHYLFQNNSINRIYFTNSSFFSTSEKLFDRHGNYLLTKRDAFQLFLKGAHDYGITIDFGLPDNHNGWININEAYRLPILRRSINNTLLKKVYIKLRLQKNGVVKIFDAVSCISPAAVNRGMSRRNACVQNYSALNNAPIETSPELLLKCVLENFFENSLHQIIQYNS
jgi:hypothetical protein